MIPIAIPKPITGREIPLAIYGRLRRNLECIYIVTPFLEDYEFFSKSPLSWFLLKHIAAGTRICILTMPPEGTNGTKRAFSRKYRLLNSLNTRGVEVHLNPQLHAKIFLFDESAVARATIVGSANLTTPAMNERLEVALLSFNRELYQRVLSIVKKFLNHQNTKTFLRWKIDEARRIKQILGGAE